MNFLHKNQDRDDNYFSVLFDNKFEVFVIMFPVGIASIGSSIFYMIFIDVVFGLISLITLFLLFVLSYIAILYIDRMLYRKFSSLRNS